MRRPAEAKRDAAVTNDGTITVAEHGLAALVAPNVKNSGVINAKLGRVVLAGKETFAVDLYGDGLLSFDGAVTVCHRKDHLLVRRRWPERHCR